MGSLPIIDDIWRVTLNWRRGLSASAHNVMHFRNATDDPQDVYDAINAHVTNAMWDAVVNDSEVHSLTLLKLDGSSASAEILTGEPEKWSGQSTGTDAIPQGCEVVSFQTALRGRSHRGRAYLPWISEGEQTNGNMEDVSATQTAWTAFVVAEALVPNPLVVASYKLASAEDVTGLVVRAQLRTQRRRALR